MNYIAHFVGRRKGAIGIFQSFQVPIIAPNPDAARLLLYEMYQDVLQCIIVRQPEAETA